MKFPTDLWSALFIHRAERLPDCGLGVLDETLPGSEKATSHDAPLGLACQAWLAWWEQLISEKRNVHPDSALAGPVVYARDLPTSNTLSLRTSRGDFSTLYANPFHQFYNTACTWMMERLRNDWISLNGARNLDAEARYLYLVIPTAGPTPLRLAPRCYLLPWPMVLDRQARFDKK